MVGHKRRRIIEQSQSENDYSDNDSNRGNISNSRKRKRTRTERYGNRESTSNYDTIFEEISHSETVSTNEPEIHNSCSNCSTTKDELRSFATKLEDMFKFLISLDCRLKEFMSVSRVSAPSSQAVPLQSPVDLPVNCHDKLRKLNTDLMNNEFKTVLVSYAT